MIDESTLLAVAIRVTECNYKETKCVEFIATPANLDCDTRTVTFDDQDYSGFVCKGAILTDAEGKPHILTKSRKTHPGGVPAIRQNTAYVRKVPTTSSQMN